MKKWGFCELGFAKVDTDRKRRKGFPEVIYCPGKTNEHLKKISRELLKNKQELLLTKLEAPAFRYLKRSLPRLKYNPLGKIGYLTSRKVSSPGEVLVVCAGTADIPVAEEAVTTLQAMGSRSRRLYDAGVAGLHRLMQHEQLLREAKAIIVVAGMEGALASVVSSLVSCPVVAVPTSCGYGANFKGLAALLTMLNGCSPGVAVVNIDNGFGAGYFAAMINK